MSSTRSVISYLSKKYKGQLVLSKQDAERETLVPISKDMLDDDGRISIADVAHIIAGDLVVKKRSRREIIEEYTIKLQTIW